MTENTTQVVIPFKDQESANIVKIQLKDLSAKLQTTVQPVSQDCPGVPDRQTIALAH